MKREIMECVACIIFLYPPSPLLFVALRPFASRDTAQDFYIRLTQATNEEG